ncbi:CUGBP Elav-like family member 6 [Mesocricetus auratus]|uniref:CUGBP Elav-like family member 6 n=1 Tax=Mesocricetus auratus TaxID=10036 RepID=A0A1U7QTB9_MESAU|nr:CUGBP Elav-like family member 6 [Mesocricetus auratus]
MNTASLAVRKYSKKDQFHEGFRIDATRNEQDAGKMFIGGLSPELKEQALLEYLSQFGEIVDFIIKVDPNTGLSRGFGFVIFKDSSTVKKVLKVKDHQIDGKKIHFKRAKAIESQFPIKKVFVGGLNPQMSVEKIRAYFGTFGEIETVELPLCSATKKRRAFGFIKYTEEHPARKVLETRFHFIGSSRCEVKIAIPKEYLGRQQSKSKAKSLVSERKPIPAARLKRHWGEGCNQGFQFMSASDTQEVNLDAHRASPCTFRANSNTTGTSSSGFRDNPSEFQENSNTLGTNSSAFMASQNDFRPNSNTGALSNYAPRSNPNAIWANQDALVASPNALRASEYTLEPYTNAFGVSQCALASYPNALGISQHAMGATPNVFWTNQYPLRTNPNALGVSQYVSGTSPNTSGESQYTWSANSGAFRPNCYAFVENPNDFSTGHCALATSPSVFRTSPCDLRANSNSFEASQYAVGATQNAFGANQNTFGANGNFCGTTGSSRSTEGLNFSQVHGNFLNVCNTHPDLHGSNGDYFFLYSYRAYDLASVLNSNVPINNSSPLGNGYQGNLFSI